MILRRSHRILVQGVTGKQGTFWTRAMIDYGAAVVVIVPQAINIARDWIAQVSGAGGVAIPGLEVGVFGLILIFFILFEPLGIHGRMTKWKVYFELFPFYRRDMFRRQKSYLRTERMR